MNGQLGYLNGYLGAPPHGTGVPSQTLPPGFTPAPVQGPIAGPPLPPGHPQAPPVYDPLAEAVTSRRVKIVVGAITAIGVGALAWWLWKKTQES